MDESSWPCNPGRARSLFRVSEQAYVSLVANRSGLTGVSSGRMVGHAARLKSCGAPLTRKIVRHAMVAGERVDATKHDQRDLSAQGTG